jgi:hypothetical protein
VTMDEVTARIRRATIWVWRVTFPLIVLWMTAAFYTDMIDGTYLWCLLDGPALFASMYFTHKYWTADQ